MFYILDIQNTCTLFTVNVLESKKLIQVIYLIPSFHQLIYILDIQNTCTLFHLISHSPSNSAEGCGKWS